MRKTGTAVFGIVILALILSCGRTGDVVPVITLTVGDVRVKSGGEAYAPAKVAQVIQKGDVIMTGADSHVTVQLGDTGIVQIAADSKVEAAALFGAGRGEFVLTRGTMVSRINKLQKGGTYAVKTPTSIAAVRGTVFSVTFKGMASTVGVSKGEVQVTQLATGKVEPVAAGKAADVTDSIEIRDLTKRESLVLSKADITVLIEGAPGMGPEALEEKGKSSLPELEKIDREIEELTPLSFESIKVKYGRIDVVTLYSGKIYRGAIVSRGASMKLITPQGPVEILASKVKMTGLQQ